MRNAQLLGTKALVDSLAQRLGSLGGEAVTTRPASNGQGFDAIVAVQFQHVSLSLAVEVKLRAPRSRTDVAFRPDAPAGTIPVLVAPFLSPAIRDELRRSGWSYWDATGNLLIWSADPMVWLDREGATRNPSPESLDGPQRLRSLKGKAASEVIVRLLSTRRAASVRELSRETGAGLGTVSRVVDLLREEGFLEDTGGGQILVADQLELAKRWTMDYGFESTFKPNRYFSLLGEDIALDRLRESTLTYALTGPRAASAEFEREGRISPLPAMETWLYTDDVPSMERALDLAHDRRGTLLVARCEFLQLSREGAQGTEPRLAVPWRIIGDLLSAGGRLSTVGEELAALQPRGVTA